MYAGRISGISPSCLHCLPNKRSSNTRWDAGKGQQVVPAQIPAVRGLELFWGSPQTRDSTSRESPGQASGTCVPSCTGVALQEPEMFPQPSKWVGPYYLTSPLTERVSSEVGPAELVAPLLYSRSWNHCLIDYTLCLRFYGRLVRGKGNE